MPKSFYNRTKSSIGYFVLDQKTYRGHFVLNGNVMNGANQDLVFVKIKVLLIYLKKSMVKIGHNITTVKSCQKPSIMPY